MLEKYRWNGKNPCITDNIEFMCLEDRNTQKYREGIVILKNIDIIRLDGA